MTLGEILDKAIRIYRQNFMTFIGIFAIPYIPLVLIQMVVSVLYTTTVLDSSFLEGTDPTAAMGMAFAAIGGSLLYLIANFILVGGFATAAITRAVANNYMDKPIGILDSYRAISGSVWKLVLALLLATLLLILIALWSIVPIVGWLSGPGIFVFFAIIVMPLLAPIASLEKLGITQIIRRAWDMGRSRFWWLIGYALILALLGQLIVTGPVYLLGAVLQGVLFSIPDMSLEMQSILNTITTTLLNMALGLLYTPLQLTMMTVVYFDLRARNEGLDLALQLSSLNENQTESSSALPEISGTQQGTSWITGIDIGRFALLSLIGVVLFGCYFLFIFSFLGALGGLF
jgi:hypothetical protein